MINRILAVCLLALALAGITSVSSVVVTTPALADCGNCN